MARLGLVFSIATIALASPILAQTRVAVPGAPGVELIVIPIPAGANIDAVLPQVIDKVGAAQGGISQHAAPTQVTVNGTPMRVETVGFNKAPGVAVFFLSVPQGKGVCMAGIPLAQVRLAAKAASAACLGAIGGGAGTAAPTGRGATAASPPRAGAAPMPAGPAAHADNWAKVDGVYFRNLPAFGVGGMFIMKFIPVILFKDGSYYEIDDAALEDIDLAAARAAHPNDWGRWSQRGDHFTLAGAKGKPNDYDLQQGNFFKAFPATGTAALTGSYKTIGGGGNTALGGDVMIASQNSYTFLPGGAYTTERSTGATNSGQYTGVSSTVSAHGGGQGRFTVDRFTITMQSPDGRTTRRFFAFGSQKSPALIDKDMLFLGNSVYTIDR